MSERRMTGGRVGARLLVVACAVLAAAACKDQAKSGGEGKTKYGIQQNRVRVGGLGEKRLDGDAIDLRLTRDGKVATALLDGEKPRLEGVPPTMRLGVLWALPTGGGEAVKLASGVTNMPGGLLFTQDSKWALLLSGYNASNQTGELLAADLTNLGAEKVRVGGPVSYYVASSDSKLLAYVEEGVLRLGALPNGPFRQVAGEVATAGFSPDLQQVYFRRKFAAGGGLFQAPVADDGKPPRRVTDLVGDHELSPDGKFIAYAARESPGSSTFSLYVADAQTLKSKKVADNVVRFRYSASGKHLARLQGDLSAGAGAMMGPGTFQTDVGDLWVGPPDGGKGALLGTRVRDFAFMDDDTKIVFRQNYVELSLVGSGVERIGELTVVDFAAPDKPRVLEKRCPNFLVSPDGKALAFTAAVRKPEFTRYLYVLPPGAEAPTKLKDWIYEYDFSPQSDVLYYRAECTREGRSCWLMSSQVAKPDAPAVQVVEAVYSFKLSEDGQRILTVYAHTQADTFDVSVFNVKTKERKTVEQYVRLPAYFTVPDGSHVAYVVQEKGRRGVYIAGQGVP